MSQNDFTNSIAIIGMAGRFPGANDISSFWKNICEKKDTLSSFSDEQLLREGIPESQIRSIDYVKSRGILNEIEWFDDDFFGFTPREAQITDPQHRLFLECSWEALENAGYSPDKYPGSIGVYGGCGISSYYLHNIHPNQQTTAEDFLLRIGNDKDFLTTRVSYKLNLNGPSITVQTACSTSLVAVSTACDHLLTYQCDMALAGGVSIFTPQISGYTYAEGMIFSQNGKCSPFDASAQGTVRSNGVGIVVLKRLHDALQDRDHILCVIKGYGVNNDGSEKMSYSAPSMNGQEKVISSAISMADVDPETIGYMEAHGTGTLLGDPIEIQGLTNAFQSKKFQFCALGSVKSNIGHTFEAAGVISLIKVILSLYHQKIPPSLNFQTPNPHIAFEKTPFYVNTTLKYWDTKGYARRACVSSFGIGGTNVHMVLEEWPQKTFSEKPRAFYQLHLSARTLPALKTMATNFGNYLTNHPEIGLANVAYTLKIGRKSFNHKRVITCKSREEAISLLMNFSLDDPFPSNFESEGCYDDEQCYRIPLPTYPFEKKRHWVDPPDIPKESASNTVVKSQNIERIVGSIWEECLGMKSIGLHDDFFQIGGDSLLAVELTVKLSTYFNITLGTQALFTHSTIAKLSEVISAYSSLSATSPLIKLGKKNQGTPLFLIHPIEGNLFCYKDLISELTCKNPLYGIQSVDNEAKSIEELSSFYIQEIRQTQPSGPYHLIGASFGGIVSYEIARQLCESGESIDLLCLLDAANPTLLFASLDNDEKRLESLMILLENKPMLPGEVTQKKMMQALGLSFFSFQEQQVIFERIKNHLRMLYNYTPKSYKGKIQLFQSDIMKNSDLLMESWAPLVDGNIEIHKIHGNHLSILKYPQLLSLINFLETHIEILHQKK